MAKPTLKDWCEGFPDLAAKEIETLRAALNDAAWAIFQMKRMQPDAIRQFASDAHTKACDAIDGLTETDGMKP